MVYEKKDMI